MNLFKKIKNARLLYCQNSNTINKDNERLLKAFYWIAMFSMAILSILSFFLNAFVEEKNVIISGLIFFILLYVSHLILLNKIKKYVALETKIFENSILFFTLLLSTVCNQQDTGVIFLVLLLAMPFTFIQKPPYSFVQTGIYYVAYIILCVIFKPFEKFIVDIVTSTITTFIAFYLIFSVSFQKIENVDSSRLISNQINIDELTKLSNRRKLNKFVAENRTLFEDADADISIIMLDIDFFKYFNDTYGHLQGDVCLEMIADVLKDINVKYNCDFVRYGGEEFATILIGKDYKFASNICREIIQKIYKLKIENKSSTHNWVSISAGVASKKKNKTKSYSQLIECADKALYVAKQNGKNCYAIYDQTVDNEIKTL